jgi:hypothetical protein
MDDSNPDDQSNPQSSPPPIRQISKRKVIYVDLDEEITSIFERIQRLNYEEVYLVVPERAVLLQSVVNLQILDKNVKRVGKSISIITHDPIGINLAHKAGISVYDQLNAPTFSPESKAVEMSEEESAKPIRAVSNEIDNDQPERLKQKKLSIFDIVRKKKGTRSLSVGAFKKYLKSRKESKLFTEPSKFAVGAPSRKSMIGLVVASLCILLLISYVALPGATVKVTPQFNVIEQSVNITLADATLYGTSPSIGDTAHAIAFYPIDLTIEKTIDYTSTGQIFEGTNASGYVTFINERATDWPLVAFTRIQTDEGLVYRVQEAVTIPRANTEAFGSLEVLVVADEEDAYGRVMGERGNIGTSSFVLPGLREDSQKELYARSSGEMIGGSTSVILQISQEDLVASDGLMVNTLQAAVDSELQSEVSRRNELNETNLELLTGYLSVETGEPSIDVPSQLVGSNQDTFQVSGSLQVEGMAFNYDEFLLILQQELENRKSPDKTLLKIDADSISYEIFEVDESPGQVKLTATIKGIEAYNLDPETEGGAKIIKKIKEHIAGNPTKESEDYVQNLPEINKVQISSWPVWSPTIPTVIENIEIKIDEEWLKSMQE